MISSNNTISPLKLETEASLTRLSITLRFALLLRAGAAGRFRLRLALALGLALSRLPFLLLVLGRAALQGRRRVLLPLVEADLLLTAHTRDRSPAGAGPRWGGTTTGGMQGADQ